MPSIRIPFPGFYNTLFSDEVDQTEQREAEYFASEESAENYEFSEKLEEGEFAELMCCHTDYRIVHHKIAEKYPEYFNEYVKDKYDIDLKLVFEEMTSPQYYNYETDRIFCQIDADTLVLLFSMVGEEKLSKVIVDNLQSRSGFISSYSDFVQDWKDKPIDEWDYNELYMVLLALVEDDDEYDLNIYYRMSEAGVFDSARDEGFDFVEFEAAVNDKIAEKEEA